MILLLPLPLLLSCGCQTKKVPNPFLIRFRDKLPNAAIVAYVDLGLDPPTLAGKLLLLIRRKPHLMFYDEIEMTPRGRAADMDEMFLQLFRSRPNLPTRSTRPSAPGLTVARPLRRTPLDELTVWYVDEKAEEERDAKNKYKPPAQEEPGARLKVLPGQCCCDRPALCSLISPTATGQEEGGGAAGCDTRGQHDAGRSGRCPAAKTRWSRLVGSGRGRD